MHKEGLETYNDLIKMLFCFFVCLIDSLKLQLLDYGLCNCMYVTFAVITTYMTS